MAERKYRGILGRTQVAQFLEGDRLVRLDQDWHELESIIVLEGGRAAITIGPQNGALRHGQLLDKENEYFLRPRHGTDEFRAFRQVNSVAARILNSRKQIEPDRLVEEVASNFRGLDPKLVREYIRCQVAVGAFLVERTGKKKGRSSLRLSPDALSAERVRSFASAFAEEIVSQARNIANLVSHRQTTGNYREGLLRTLLQKYVPRRYHVATGFIFGSDRQLDVIIYDQLEYAPHFREGDLVVVPADAVRAVIEVKSTLTNQYLREALEILTDAVPDNVGGPPIFKGVFAFERESNESFFPTIKQFYAEESPDGELNLNAITDFYTPVTAICVVGKVLAFLSFAHRSVDQERMISPVIADLSNAAGRPAQAAVFFDLLSRHLRHPFSGSQSQNGLIDSLADELNIGPPTFIYEKLWGPYFTQDEFPESVEDLENFLTAYYDWLHGREWRLPPTRPASDQSDQT